MTETSINLDILVLGRGLHDPRVNAICLMEAVAWYAGEPHTGAPACASPTITAFGGRLNDLLPEDKRQQLKLLIPHIVDTRDDGHDTGRAYLVLDWLFRRCIPEWLDLSGRSADAAAIRALPVVDGPDSAGQAGAAVAALRPPLPPRTECPEPVELAIEAAFATADLGLPGTFAAVRDIAREGFADAAAPARLRAVESVEDSAIDLFKAMVLGAAR